jgi:uncharacterized protein YceK
MHVVWKNRVFLGILLCCVLVFHGCTEVVENSAMKDPIGVVQESAQAGAADDSFAAQENTSPPVDLPFCVQLREERVMKFSISLTIHDILVQFLMNSDL